MEATFAQLATACEAVRERARGARPMLAISANGSVASLWLAPRLAAFAALHPSVQWQVRSIEETSRTWCARVSTSPLLRARPGQLADGDRLLFSETVFPVCSPSLLPVGQRRGPVAPQPAAGGSRQQPEKAWSTWLELLGCRPKAKADDRPVRYLQRRDRRGGRGGGHRARARPLIDFELASGRLVRLFADASLPGSWDFVIRRRPDAARDMHVDQLQRFLLAQSGSLDLAAEAR